MNYSVIDLSLEEKLEWITDLIDEMHEAGVEVSMEMYDMHAHLVGEALGIDWDEIDLGE